MLRPTASLLPAPAQHNTFVVLNSKSEGAHVRDHVPFLPLVTILSAREDAKNSFIAGVQHSLTLFCSCSMHPFLIPASTRPPIQFKETIDFIVREEALRFHKGLGSMGISLSLAGKGICNTCTPVIWQVGNEIG